MQLKFRGNYAKLRKCVSRTRIDGKWRELKYGHKQYRTDDGGYLNWWETTGTLTFEGSNSAAKEELTQAFIAANHRPTGSLLLRRSRRLQTSSRPTK